jgi:hypothetical protein
MIWQILTILVACAASAWLYRLGGAGAPYNTRYRDVGCPLVLIGAVMCLFGLKTAYIWGYLITFGLSWGALSTYWQFLFKGKDNFYAHGLGCGLAGIPLIWCGVPLWIILVRIAICTAGMGLWSAWVSKDTWEERGRGALFIL